ncbi:MAG: hypothetical protein ACXVAK_05435 [Vulcanimicrobiaceae bacterium]
MCGPTGAVTTACALIASGGGEGSGYFFAHKIPNIMAAIEANRSTLLAIDDPLKFAQTVTAGLYATAPDSTQRLFAIAFFPPLPESKGCMTRR